MPPIVTRFAPSPTGFLHIGGVRTALYNLLFAKHHGGQYLLRIEDTDKERSTQEAIDAILHGLAWLGIHHDGEVVYQSQRITRHQEAAEWLIKKGHAYKCFSTPQELEVMREQAKKEGRSASYDKTWRDRDPSSAPPHAPYVVRLKVNQEPSSMIIHDQIQGKVTVERETLDDYVLLRQDGTPTYMLSVVVDDHDMNISHIIRGVDHLTNSFRQMALYEAFGWNMPLCGHIGLLHGDDGKKLSKRHGALSVGLYEQEGFLPDALTQGLATTGWSGLGDKVETASLKDMIQSFSLEKVGKNAAQFSFDKLRAINANHMRTMDAKTLLGLTQKTFLQLYSENQLPLFERAIPSLVKRANTLKELVDKASFFVNENNTNFSPSDEAHATLSSLLATLSEVAEKDWSSETIATLLKSFADTHDLPFSRIGKPLRLALTGALASPGDISDIPIILGKDLTCERIRSALKTQE